MKLLYILSSASLIASSFAFSTSGGYAVPRVGVGGITRGVHTAKIVTPLTTTWSTTNHPHHYHPKHESTSLNMATETATDSSPTNPNLISDMLAGLTVAFSLLSKAIACSAIVGVNPLVGIWSSVIMGLTAPLIGARNGVISGTAAVVVVPLSALTQGYGVEYMVPCILLSGMMQGVFGLANLSKWGDLVSEEVLSGFLNGLGFILLFSQASVFQAAKAAGALVPAVSMSSLCFAIVQLLPRFTKVVPSSLVGLVVASGLGRILKLPLATLASGAAEGTFAGGLASLPKVVDLGLLKGQMRSKEAIQIVMPAAISIMIIALVETLLAGKVVDDMTGQKLCTYDDEDKDPNCPKYDVPKRSVLAMSFGNILSSLLGGFGGCGLIPQTVLNIKSGGVGKWSSISYAIAMASFVVFFAPLVGKISQAALAGIMITVAYDTIAWQSSVKSFKAVMNPSKYKDEKGKVLSRMQSLIDLVALGISSGICYFGNLAVGIIAGVVFQRGLSGVYRRFGSDGVSAEGA